MSFKYSVIIPHYNSEDGLERLLKSIPNKDFIEVIVVDDRSSTELFKDVINKSDLVNIAGYINEGVKGAGAARNIGLEKAKGKFLIFADADDFFTENAFSKIDNVISADKEYNDIYFFNVTSQSSNGGIGFRHIKNSTLVTNYIESSNSNNIDKIKLTHNVPWGKVFRAEFIKNNSIKFDEVIVSNDVMFSVKTGKLADNIFCSNEIIYCVTQSEGTLTTKKSVDNLWVRLEVYARYYHYLTDEEKKKIGASPIPLLFQSLKYGPLQTFKVVCFLKKRKIRIFKYLIEDKAKLARVSKEYLAKIKP